MLKVATIMAVIASIIMVMVQIMFIDKDSFIINNVKYVQYIYLYSNISYAIFFISLLQRQIGGKNEK